MRLLPTFEWHNATLQSSTPASEHLATYSASELAQRGRQANRAIQSAGNKLWEWFSFGRYGTGGYDVRNQASSQLDLLAFSLLAGPS